MVGRARPGPPQRPSPESTSKLPLDVQEYFYQLEGYMQSEQRNNATLESNAFTGEQTISVANQAEGLTVASSHSSAVTGPIVFTERTATGVSGHALGRFDFAGRDDAGNYTTYAYIGGSIIDATNGSEDARCAFGTTIAGVFGIRAYLGGGFYNPSASGGDKGNNTINFGAVYDDNTLLTCYVLDAAIDGEIDEDKWDEKVPDIFVEAEYEDYIVPVVGSDGGSVFDKNGKPLTEVYHHEIKPAKKEARIHKDMRKFKARLGTEFDPLDIDKYTAHWKQKRHLTSMPNEEKFDPIADKMATGQWIQRLVETVEIQAVHISKLNDRLSKVEGLLQNGAL